MADLNTPGTSTKANTVVVDSSQATTMQLEDVLRKQNTFDAQFAVANRNSVRRSAAGSEEIVAKTEHRHNSSGSESPSRILNADIATSGLGTAEFASLIQAGGLTVAPAPHTADVLDTLLDIEAAANSRSNNNNTDNASKQSVPDSVGEREGRAQPLVVTVRIGQQVVEVPIDASQLINQQSTAPQDKPIVAASIQRARPVDVISRADRDMASRVQSILGQVPRQVVRQPDNYHNERSLLPDTKRITTLERNKMAAVRYRQRKREEVHRTVDRLDDMQRVNMQLQAKLKVLKRDLSSAQSQLLLYTRECKCGLAERLQPQQCTSYEPVHENHVLVDVVGHDDTLYGTTNHILSSVSQTGTRLATVM